MYGCLLLSYFYDSQLDDAYGNKKIGADGKELSDDFKEPSATGGYGQLQHLGISSYECNKFAHVAKLSTHGPLRVLPTVSRGNWAKLYRTISDNTIVGEDIMKCGITADKLQTFFQQECNCTLPRIIFTKFCEMLAGEQKCKYNKPSVTSSATSSATNKQGSYINYFCSDAAKTRT